MKRITALALVAVTLASCALPPLTPDQQAQVVTQINQGQTVLTCSSVECAGPYGGHLRDLQNFYAAGDWRDLGIMVVQLNFSEDLAYFYLGLSAEGSGADAAALHYYQLAVDGATGATPMSQCHVGSGLCNGFNLPADIYPHIQAVQEAIARREAPPPPPKPKHIYHPKPKAGDWQNPTPDSP
jgi:hypothetical protein